LLLPSAGSRCSIKQGFNTDIILRVWCELLQVEYINPCYCYTFILLEFKMHMVVMKRIVTRLSALARIEGQSQASTTITRISKKLLLGDLVGLMIRVKTILLSRICRTAEGEENHQAGCRHGYLLLVEVASMTAPHQPRCSGNNESFRISIQSDYSIFARDD
jgi:hypothetical protein